MRPSRPATRFRLLAPLTVQSGLGTAARSYHASLIASSSEVECLPITIGHEHHPTVEFSAVSAFRGRHDRPTDKDQLITLAQYNADGFEAFLQHHREDFWAPCRHRVAIWVWELARFRSEWKKYEKILDSVWAPTRFVQEAVASMLDCPVHVVPYSMSEAIPATTRFRSRFSMPATDFVFCSMFDASSYADRKNPVALLQAFARVRKQRPEARLLLKITHPHLAEEYFSKPGHGLLDFTGVTKFSDNLRSDEVLGLIAEADCLVSAHRSEGFGLTIAEALQVGKPVVATNYGGSTDFLDETTGFPVPYRLIPIENDLGPYQKGIPWADIDVEQLALRMLEVMEDPAAAQRKAAAGRNLMATQFSPAAIGRLIKDLVS
jgi:glycosyltransferase involved in cell wall biosynthesis